MGDAMSPEDRVQLAVLLARASDTPTFQLLDSFRRLLRAARTYQRLAETACNRELTPRESASVERLEKRLTQHARELGCGVTFSGDPRGYVVKLQLPSGASNTLGNDGWGIG